MLIRGGRQIVHALVELERRPEWLLCQRGKLLRRSLYRLAGCLLEADGRRSKLLESFPALNAGADKLDECLCRVALRAGNGVNGRSYLAELPSAYPGSPAGQDERLGELLGLFLRRVERSAKRSDSGQTDVERSDQPGNMPTEGLGRGSGASKDIA